jgi:flagellar basal-body rod modification protein FlgD
VTGPVAAIAGQAVSLDPGLMLEAGGGRGPSGALDKDAFLKLLVAQLRYQNPLNPTSNEQFIATTAQFTTIERLDELAKQGLAAAQVSALATASALVGRQVSVLGAGGQLLTATVLRGQFVAGALTLQTDLGPVGLDQVVAVGPAPSPAPSTTPTPTETTP